MKKKISAPDILGDSTWHSRYFEFNNNFYLNAHLFNTRNLIFFLVSFTFIFGWFRPVYWAVTLSLSIYLAYSFLRARALAGSLDVKRSMEPKGRATG